MTLITLLGEPKSTQHIYKFRCAGRIPMMYMDKDGKGVKESYQWQAKSQWKKKLLTEPLEVKIDLFFANKRNHDIDNYNKILLDSLTGIVWEDDGLIQSMTVSKSYDKSNPRIEITIYERN